jgi:hypothetical protein
LAVSIPALMLIYPFVFLLAKAKKSEFFGFMLGIPNRNAIEIFPNSTDKTIHIGRPSGASTLSGKNITFYESMAWKNPNTGTGTNIVIDTSTGEILQYSSSVKYKTNIETLDLDINKYLSIRPVQFNWKRDGKRGFGFIAEELEYFYPELVLYNENYEPEAVQYMEFVPYLHRVAQIHHEHIDKLQKKIRKLERKLKKLNDLEARLKKLEEKQSRWF